MPVMVLNKLLMKSKMFGLKKNCASAIYHKIYGGAVNVLSLLYYYYYYCCFYYDFYPAYCPYAHLVGVL